MRWLQKKRGILVGGGCGFLHTPEVTQFRKRPKQGLMSLFLQWGFQVGHIHHHRSIHPHHIWPHCRCWKEEGSTSQQNKRRRTREFGMQQGKVCLYVHTKCTHYNSILAVVMVPNSAHGTASAYYGQTTYTNTYTGRVTQNYTQCSGSAKA